MRRNLLVAVVSVFTTVAGVAFTGRYSNAWVNDDVWFFSLAVITAGLIPLGAGLIALLYPRAASRVLLVIAIPAFLSSYVVFGFAFSAVVVLAEVIGPGLLLWVLTRNHSEGLIIARSRRSKVVTGALAGTAFVLLLVVATSLPLMAPWWPNGDCSGSPFFLVNGTAQHLEFTADIRQVGRHDSLERDISLWSIARIEHAYTPVPHFPFNYVILRGRFRDEDRGLHLLVDGRTSHGLLYRLLPIIEPVPCGRTKRIANAAAELHLLNDPGSRTGVRIVGAVYRKSIARGGAAPGVVVHVDGSNRRDVITDEEGLFDLSALPPARYTIWVENDFVGRWTGDLKDGDVPVLNFRVD